MGADLILTFARTGKSGPDIEAGRKVLASYTNKQINDDLLEHDEYFDVAHDDDEDGRVYLEAAINEVQYAWDGHRYAYPLGLGPDDALIIAGGSSWGDDPYEGWSNLSTLFNADTPVLCAVFEALKLRPIDEPPGWIELRQQ